jgi:hypothetical protein
MMPHKHPVPWHDTRQGISPLQGRSGSALSVLLKPTVSKGPDTYITVHVMTQKEASRLVYLQHLQYHITMPNIPLPK